VTEKPSPRAFHSSALCQDRDTVYFFGGRGKGDEVLSETWSLTRNSDGRIWSWCRKADSDQKRYQHTADFIDSDMIVFGGRGSANFSIFNAKTNTWTEENTEENRSRHASWVVGRSLFV